MGLLLPGVLLGCGADGGSGGHGTGGVPASGGVGNSGGSGGTSSGGMNHPDGTLRTLACMPGGLDRQWEVGETSCSLSADHLELAVGHTGETVFSLLRVGFGGQQLGTHFTEYGGSMIRGEVTWGPNSVRLGGDICFGPASVYTPDPCEIELLALDRGEVQAGGAGGTRVEEGSRVRLRVACPDGLYAPGGDDYGPTLVELIPEEFELEARDCYVAAE